MSAWLERNIRNFTEDFQKEKKRLMTITEYWILLIQEGAQLSEALPEDSDLWFPCHKDYPAWAQGLYLTDFGRF